MRTDTSSQRRTELGEARERLYSVVSFHGRVEMVPLSNADGRVLIEEITATRSVPHYTRAAMDGYAVRSEDTVGAEDRSPVTLDKTEGQVRAGEAARIHTGGLLPAGADAVIMVERTEDIAGEVVIFDSVVEGKNVAPAGEDVEAGERLFEPGRRLNPPDLGLLKSVGIREVPVADNPAVSVIPTGEEIVDGDPAPGETVETNGLMVSRYVTRWGGTPDHRGIVADEPAALRSVIERELSNDLVVTIGGSSIGERDIVPETVAELGEVFVHGVAIKPGHPVALGEIKGTPVIMLPGYPVSSVINAVQFLRPAINWLCGSTPRALPSVKARLREELRSETGLRTFARVRVDERDGRNVVVPVQTSGAGVLSSVTRATGWVEIDEHRKEVATGESVTVQDWDRTV